MTAPIRATWALTGVRSASRTNSLLDKCNDVMMTKKSGYSGHIPNARDAFGTTVYDHYPAMNSAFRAGDKPHMAGAEHK